MKLVCHLLKCTDAGVCTPLTTVSGLKVSFWELPQHNSLCKELGSMLSQVKPDFSVVK